VQGGPDSDPADLAMTYNVTSLTKKQIKLNILFEKPLAIQPSDKLFVVLNFEEFEAGLKDGTALTRQMTRQVKDNAVTQSVDAFAKGSTVLVAAAVASSAVLNTVLAGSLAQVWGMINGMQILVHMPVFNVQFPAVSFLVVGKIVEVATFDIPYVESDYVFGNVVTLSEDDSIFSETEGRENLVDAMD